MKKIWRIHPPSPHALSLAHEAGLTRLQAQLLINRGILDPDQATAFLAARLNSMADPFLMKGMPAAAELLAKAIERRENITVYGDYDADGLTAAALLVRFLSSIGVHAEAYIPDRLVEGYGLNREAIQKIHDQGSRCMVTVDCGISARKEVALAKQLGLGVVVTDHHQIPVGPLPDCPVVNPHQKDCLFPDKSLSGAGLAFYLAVALRAELRRRGWFGARAEPNLREYLDLVALGTVADRVLLLDQNRILVHAGLRQMASSRWPGIRAMVGAAGLEGDTILSGDVGFRLAPRLNAPGRLGDSSTGLEILISDQDDWTRTLAARLNVANGERQRLEQDVLQEIERELQRNAGFRERSVLFFSGEGWHPGVLGIVASRLVDAYHRPSFLFQVSDGVAKGSGRSIEGFDLYQALCCFPQLMLKFGGHAYAAGITLEKRDLGQLQSALEGHARQHLSAGDLLPSIMVDAEVRLAEITCRVIRQMMDLAPFGLGNPEPVFCGRSLEVVGSRVVGNRHLKLHVKEDDTVFEAIGFGLGGWHSLYGKRVDMLFTPEINRWQGNERIQLRVLDLNLPTGSRT